MRAPAPSAPLVAVDELAELLLLDEALRPVVLDVRYPGVGSTDDGHAQYLEGHVPGAAYIDLDAVLAAPHEPGRTGRHPLPAPDVFEAGMRAAGVRQGRAVVVYDDWMSIAAARAWWLLRYFGHGDVRVLDGGWRAWADAGQPVATGERPPTPGDLRAEPGHRALVGADQTARIAGGGILLDARPENRYRGEDETIDPVAGRIPGARSFPARSLVDARGRFLPSHELADRFRAARAVEGAVVAVYCGSGIQACQVALAADVAGVLADPAVYAGSWSEWITDPDRPVERG